MQIFSEVRGAGGKKLVMFVQVFSYGTVTGLKTTALVACPAHVVLLNIYAGNKRWLVEDGLTSSGNFCRKGEHV